MKSLVITPPKYLSQADYQLSPLHHLNLPGENNSSKNVSEMMPIFQVGSPLLERGKAMLIEDMKKEREKKRDKGCRRKKDEVEEKKKHSKRQTDRPFSIVLTDAPF
jgi:hypothetical protein